MTTLNEPRATSATWDLDGSQQYLANDFSSSGCDVSDHRIDLLSEFKGWNEMADHWSSATPAAMDEGNGKRK